MTESIDPTTYVAAPSRFVPRSEREAFGRSLRDRIKRIDQNKWPASGSDRAREVVARLRTAEVGRREDLLPIKYQRMAASPFGFMRGAAPVMAVELSTMPHTGYDVQICGDAHVRNMGAFAGPDGRICFDVNDFDETCRAPWEWDLRRLAISIVLVGRESGNSDGSNRDAVMAMVAAWRESLREFAGMPGIELARYQVHRFPRNGVIGRVLSRAENWTATAARDALTEPGHDGRPRFVDRMPKLLRATPEQSAHVLAALPAYRDTLGPARQQVLDSYRPYDVAFKVVGTGSVGTRDYVVLCEGNGPTDPLILQVKQSVTPSYSALLPPALRDHPRISRHHGRRVAEGQHRLQTWVDPFLGWTTLDGFDFLVRQLADHKASIEPGELRRDALIEYSAVAGEVFAKAHSRTGDAAILYGYAGEAEKLDRALASFELDGDDSIRRRPIDRGLADPG